MIWIVIKQYVSFSLFYNQLTTNKPFNGKDKVNVQNISEKICEIEKSLLLARSTLSY